MVVEVSIMVILLGWLCRLRRGLRMDDVDIRGGNFK